MPLVVMLMCLLVSSSLIALELRLPLGMVTRTNELKKTELDLAAGVTSYVWLWRKNRFISGPMVGIFGSTPLQYGSDVVRISRYRVVSEAGFSAALTLGEERIDVRPFVDVFGVLGVLLINKKVATNDSLLPRLIYGGGARAGLSYWIKSYGLHSSYSLSALLDGFAHRLEIGFMLNL